MLSAYLNPKVSKPTKAFWFLKSNNKNWNSSGAFIYRGMRGIPVECSIKIEELKLKFGEPPEDLEWGFKLGVWGYYRKKIKYFFLRRHKDEI